ncbi:MAG: TolC family protein [Xanthomonadales bacterium]|nr:TolC family protein [Xanthomonadales bacterium]
MLPQINLSASGGSSALHAGDLFAAGTRSWSLGLNLLQPLFHAGALRHQQRASQAGMDKAAADWQQTVLVAFANVADTLQALQFDALALKAQTQAEQAAAKLLDLTQTQYQVGAINYIKLLDAQRQHRQSRIALIQARSARLADTAALYAALGGSWQQSQQAQTPASPE